MKKLIGFVVILAAAGGGWWYYVKFGQEPEKATVSELTISRGNIVEAVSATGALEPRRRYDVGSQVSGVVKAIYVDYNSMVKAGQLLAEIDPSLLQVQVDIQTANVERQKGDIANQEVQLEDQKKQFERTKQLYEKGLQNQQQFEAAELAIKTRASQIELSKKSLLSVEQQLNQAKLNVSYTKITAPADGVVVERRVDVGQTVQASMSTPSFFVLSEPLESLKLTAGVDETDIGKIRPGMEVRFNVDAYGQKTFYGTVEAVRLNATNQNSVVTYPVWITVPNPNLELRPAMTAQIRIVLSEVNDVIRVPSQATRFRPTREIYTALGLVAPEAGRGGTFPGAGQGQPETNNNGAAPTPGAQPAGQNARAGGQGGDRQPAVNGGGGANQNQTRSGGGQNAQNAPGGSNRQPGVGGNQQGGQNRPSGRGFGQNSDLQNMSPEARKELMDRIARMGGPGGNNAGRGGNTGRGGGGTGMQARGGGGGRGGGNAGNNAQRQAAQAAAAQRTSSDAPKIDDLWAPIQKANTRSSVWKWDEAKKELTQVQVTLGVTDGSFSELLSGDLKVGDKVVSGVTLPASMRPQVGQPGQNSPFGGGQQNRGMPGGMPNMGGGGGGNPGGGGGGGGRGGGRGGN